MNVNSALKETSRGVVGSRSVLGKSLLVVQVAISLVLLVGAGLFLRTLSNLRHVDVGFNPQNLLLFRVNPALNRYDEKRWPRSTATCSTVSATVPGVRGVAMSAPALLSGSVNSTSIYVQGRAYAPDAREQRTTSINRLVISPNFFDVMGIPIVNGRGFTDRDDASSPKVVVINEAAAKKYFPEREPDRPAIRLEHRNDAASSRVVGVLRDVKYDSVREAAPPTMYVPYPQTRVGSPVFEVRTAGAAGGRHGRGPRGRAGRSIRTCR